MELSVIVPTFGGATRLPETLAALARATAPAGGFEVLVADDGSPDPPPDDIGAGAAFPVRVLRTARNGGRAAACNRGARAASGRVLLVLDDDMTIAPDALAGHVAAHDPARSARGVVGRIVPDPLYFTGRFGAFLAAEEEARRERLRTAAALSFLDCLTGHFSIPREALLAAGGYDESFTRYGYEDIDLAFRLERAGVPLAYRDDLVAKHRSAHVGFARHCSRHRESGAMAVVFAARHDDARLREFLRTGGMTASPGASAFLRVMARTHALARSAPEAVAPALLGSARGLVHLLELTAPRRVLHAAYHVVRDMHYARGIAAERRRTQSKP